MRKKLISILTALTIILTGINISNTKESYAQSKDPNKDYMTFFIMGRFTAYPTQNGNGLQATWNSGN